MAEEKVVKLLNADAGMERQENRITEELHKVVRGEEAALEHDVFFAEGFRAYTDLQNRTGSLLQHGDDYEFSEADSIATEISGRDCYRKLVVHADIDKCYVDYHAYGDFIRAEELDSARKRLEANEKKQAAGEAKLRALELYAAQMNDALASHMNDTKAHGASEEGKAFSIALRGEKGTLRAAPAGMDDECVVKKQLDNASSEAEKKFKSTLRAEALSRIAAAKEAVSAEEAALFSTEEELEENGKENAALEESFIKRFAALGKIKDEAEREAARARLEAEREEAAESLLKAQEKRKREQLANATKPFHSVIRTSRGTIKSAPAVEEDEVVVKSQLAGLHGGGGGAYDFTGEEVILTEARFLSGGARKRAESCPVYRIAFDKYVPAASLSSQSFFNLVDLKKNNVKEVLSFGGVIKQLSESSFSSGHTGSVYDMNSPIAQTRGGVTVFFDGNALCARSAVEARFRGWIDFVKKE